MEALVAVVFTAAVRRAAAITAAAVMVVVVLRLRAPDPPVDMVAADIAAEQRRLIAVRMALTRAVEIMPLLAVRTATTIGPERHRLPAYISAGPLLLMAIGTASETRVRQDLLRREASVTRPVSAEIQLRLEAGILLAARLPLGAALRPV